MKPILALYLSKISGSYLKNPHGYHLASIFLCTSFVYWRVWNFNFLIGWDDQWFILNRYTERGLTFSNLCDIFSIFYYGQYSPVNQIYYTCLHQLFGYNPKYFHIASVLLHLINSGLVYLLALTFCDKLLNVNISQKNQISCLTALFFAMSPFNVEPVAWVAASKVLLYGLFYLLAIHFYIGYIKSKKSNRFYLTLLFFILSFGAKEQAVSLPFCFFLLDYLFERNLRDLMLWYEKLPFFILSLLFGFITIHSQGYGVLEGTQFYTITQRLLLSFYTLTEYFVKTILPVNLSYLYPFPFQIGSATPWWLWLYPPTILLILFFLLQKISQKSIHFGLLFFLIHICLVINLLSLARYSVVADRYAYLSTIGLYFLLASGILKFNANGKIQKSALILVVFCLCCFIGYSKIHLDVWRDIHSLKEKMKETVEKRKDFIQWNRAKK